MIGSGAALLKDLDASARLRCRAVEHVKKVFPTNGAGAGACYKKPAGSDARDSQLVEVMVSAEGFLNGAFSLSEFGRVENDSAERSPFGLELFQNLERVAL